MQAGRQCLSLCGSKARRFVCVWPQHDHVLINSTHLLLLNTSLNDSAPYTCYVANQHGYAHQTAWLAVIPPAPSQNSQTASAQGLIRRVTSNNNNNNCYYGLWIPSVPLTKTRTTGDQ